MTALLRSKSFFVQNNHIFRLCHISYATNKIIQIQSYCYKPLILLIMMHRLIKQKLISSASVRKIISPINKSNNSGLLNCIKLQFCKKSQDKNLNKDPKITENKANQQNQLQQQKNINKYSKIFRYLNLGIIGAMLGYYCFGDSSQEISVKNEKNKESEGIQDKQKKSAGIGVQIGGSWQLIDTQGKLFSNKDLKDHYYFIYFGFSKCPDICPTTLHIITNITKYIAQDRQGRNIPLKTIFVSLDPQRDSPQKLRQYLSQFSNKHIIGVSGTDEHDPNLIDIKKAFKIYANKVSTESSYVIDHTTMVYLMDKQNQFLDIVNTSISEKQAASVLLNKILQKQIQREQKRGLAK